jgi:hypothetical protein
MIALILPNFQQVENALEPMPLHVIIIYQCRMAVSIDNIATLLLFSASHVQLARKIVAQTIHNHDKWQLHP